MQIVPDLDSGIKALAGSILFLPILVNFLHMRLYLLEDLLESLALERHRLIIVSDFLDFLNLFLLRLTLHLRDLVFKRAL